jgi:PKD repeat protein
MFSADPSTGVAPLTVTFTDTSSGAPSDRSWDFGDGSTSTLANPVHTYMTPGQYTARLTVRSSSGISRTAFSPIMVTQASAPAVTTTAPTPVHTTDDIYGTISPVTAGFTYTPDLGPVPLIVSFKDTSTGSPTTWNWNFGDGTTSNQKNPVHTYSSPGDYFVELSVTGSNGASKVKLGPVSVFYKI